MNIGTTSSLSQFATHLFVQTCHHGLACIVLQVFAITRGNRRSVGRTDTQHIDAHALGFSFFGGLYRPTFMVFAISNNDDGLAHAFLLCKAVDSHINGCGNVCSLCSNHVWRDAAKEHLCTDVVASDRQLNKGVTSKDNQSYLVVGEVVNEILDHHLRTVQTTGCYVFGQHRIADVHCDDGLNASALLMRNLCTKLRTCHHDDEQCKGCQQKVKLDSRTETRNVRHQFADQCGVTKPTQTLLLLKNHQ